RSCSSTRRCSGGFTPPLGRQDGGPPWRAASTFRAPAAIDSPRNDDHSPSETAAGICSAAARRRALSGPRERDGAEAADARGLPTLRRRARRAVRRRGGARPVPVGGCAARRRAPGVLRAVAERRSGDRAAWAAGEREEVRVSRREGASLAGNRVCAGGKAGRRGAPGGGLRPPFEVLRAGGGALEAALARRRPLSPLPAIPQEAYPLGHRGHVAGSVVPGDQPHARGEPLAHHPRTGGGKRGPAG